MRTRDLPLVPRRPKTMLQSIDLDQRLCWLDRQDEEAHHPMVRFPPAAEKQDRDPQGPKRLAPSTAGRDAN